MSNNEHETASDPVHNQPLTSSPSTGEQAQPDQDRAAKDTPEITAEKQDDVSNDNDDDTVIVASTSNGTVTVEAAADEEVGIASHATEEVEPEQGNSGASPSNEQQQEQQQQDDVTPFKPAGLQPDSQVQDTATGSTEAPASSTSALAGEQDASDAPPSSTTQTTVPDTSQDSAPPATALPESATMEPSTSTSSGTGTTAATTTPASAATVSHSARPAVAAKKFTSSLSMNKKFLEKSGAAADGKSPQPMSLPLPKAGLSAARSPALASPSIPTTGSAAASPTLANATTTSSNAPATGTSHPRLLTGKLSTLGSSGSGMMSAPGSVPATWGRPSGPSSIGTSTSTSFGRGGFVPAAPVTGGQPLLPPGGRGFPHNPPPLSAGFARGRGFPAFGGPGPGGRGAGPVMGPGLTGRGGGGGQPLPWGHSGRGGPGHAGGGGRGGNMMEHEFPSFQETARAEEQRQHAVVAKERAEKMAAVAQASYNQRLLEDLKGFSGVHSESGGMAWDELDDEDELEDILEFADGMRYEVTHSTAQPTEAEEAAFKEAEKASNEAAALHAQYEKQVAADAEKENQQQKQVLQGQGQGQNTATPDYASPVPSGGKKAEMFEDDFDRGTRDNRPAVTHPSATGQALLGRGDPANRTLFNDRLGKFEPYGGRPQQQQQQPGGKHNKDRNFSPPSVLQRASAGRGGQQDNATKGNQRIQSLQQNGNQQVPPPPSLAAARQPSQKSGPPASSATEKVQEAKKSAVQSLASAKKADSPWAKLPPVAVEPLQVVAPPAQASVQPVAQQASVPLSQQQQQNQQQAPPPTPARPSQPAVSAQPAEDPEEAYKRQMQSIAERARKRREGEELDRLAGLERAKQKLAELEAKMNQAAAAKAEKDAPSSPTVPMTAPLPTATEQSIVSPPLQPLTAGGRQDRQASWRRQSLSTPAPPTADTRNAPPPQRTLWQPPKPTPPPLAKEEVKIVTEQPKPLPLPLTTTAPVKSSVISPPSSAKAPPSSEAFAAFASSMASASWRKPIPPPPAPARTQSQAMEPVVKKHDSVLPETDAPLPLPIPSGAILSPLPPSEQPATPKLSSPKLPPDVISPPPLTAPRVRLGRFASASGPPPVESGSSSNNEAILLSHAFPQPTIIVPSRGSGVPAEPTGNVSPAKVTSMPELSAFDKIMLQVKAAQKDLKTNTVNQEEKSRSGKQEFDGALSRITKAMGDTGRSNAKGKEREIAPQPIMPRYEYVPEVFDVTKIQRPSTPRHWNIFKVKLPTKKRRTEPIPAHKLRQFQHTGIPMPIFSTSWIQPKGLQLPRLLMLEEYLNPQPAQGDFPRVKVSKLHLPSDLLYPPGEPGLGVSSGAMTVSPAIGNGENNGTGRFSDSITWRRVSVSGPDSLSQQAPTTPIEVHITTESVTVKDPPDDEIVEQEDYMTVPFEEPSAIPTSIKVSLPRSSAAKLTPQVSPETARFRTYGPKLAENATVVFRRGISPAKDIETAPAPSSSSMFLSPSEIGKEAPKVADDEISEDRGMYAQLPQEEPRQESKRVVGLSRSMEGLNGRPAKKASSPTLPAFPSLSSGFPNLPQPQSPRTAVSASSPAPTSAFDVNEKPHIPPHILEQLKKLNDTVSATPLTVAPRLDSPNQFLARTASPWATAGMTANMGPSAFSLSAIDPSMSVWSKPTEETAAAASAAKEKSGETRQENSLRGIADDYPNLMPSSALDLPISESESQHHGQERSSTAAGSRFQLDRSRASEERFKNRVVSAPSPINMPLTGRPRMPSTSASGSSRQNSFAYPSSYSHDGSIPSPYAVHASLPFSPVGMPGPQAYSPTMTHAQPAYGQYVSSAPYGHGFTSAMPAGSGGMTAVPAGYTQVPMAMTTVDGRSVWVQASQVPAGMMHGQYAAVGSPYATAHTPMQAYASQPKSRMPASPMYPQHAGAHPQSHQQRGTAPIRIDGASPFPYAYASTGSHPQQGQQHTHSQHAQSPNSYSAFSPQLYPQHMRAPGSSSSQFSRRTAPSQYHEQGPSW